jgi:hypothetical protein
MEEKDEKRPEVVFMPIFHVDPILFLTHFTQTGDRSSEHFIHITHCFQTIPLLKALCLQRLGP